VCFVTPARDPAAELRQLYRTNAPMAERLLRAMQLRPLGAQDEHDRAGEVLTGLDRERLLLHADERKNKQPS